MSTRAAVFTGLLVLAAGCSGGDDGNTSTANRSAAPTADTTAAARPPASPADSSAAGLNGSMAGMDHTGMAGKGAAGASVSTHPMAGMDHSQMAMPGRQSASAQRSSATPSSMAGMDHSQMAMPGRQAASAQRSSATPSSMAGMDHSQMAMGTTGDAGLPAESLADEKLKQIVAALMQDSMVARLVANDSVLRNRWQDAAVRRLLLKQ